MKKTVTSVCFLLVCTPLPVLAHTPPKVIKPTAVSTVRTGIEQQLTRRVMNPAQGVTVTAKTAQKATVPTSAKKVYMTPKVEVTALAPAQEVAASGKGILSGFFARLFDPDVYHADPQATRDIADAFEGEGRYGWMTEFGRMTKGVPESAILLRGRLSADQLKTLRRYYTAYLNTLQLQIDQYGMEDIFGTNDGKPTFDGMFRWANFAIVMTDVGFLGNEVQMQQVFDIAANLPKEYRALTDFIAVRTFLNMSERNILGANESLLRLAWHRSRQEHWDTTTSAEEGRITDKIYNELRLYLEEVKHPLAPHFPNPNPLNPGDILSPDLKAQIGMTQALTPLIDKQYQDHTSPDINVCLKGLKEFLELKNQMIPLPKPN